MRMMDKDGLLLCEIQGKIFEESAVRESCSSSIFIRRYMYSSFCKKLDKLYFLNESYSMEQIFDDLNQEFGKTAYGKEHFSASELYWMGYIYRYFSYAYKWDSKRVYQTINATELRKLYYPYHSLDPAQAIERMLEAKGIVPLESEEDIIKKGVEILRRIRNENN